MQCACSINDYDSDDNEFYDASYPIARKKHACCECDKPIQKGNEYESAKGKSDGNFWTEKTCMDCAEIRACFFCTWIFGQMFERLRDEIDEIELSNIEKLPKSARIKFFDNVEV